MSLPLFLALLLGCCGYAWWRGGAPERWAAGLQLGAFAVDFTLNRLVDGSTYASMQVGSAVLDTTLLTALVLLAWRSTRFWPLWLAGWQLAAVMAHLAKGLDPGMVPTGYALQSAIWAYPMLVATAIGTWRHRRRVAAGRPDEPWKAMVG